MFVRWRIVCECVCSSVFFLYIFLIFVLFTENFTHVKMISSTLQNIVYSIGLTNKSCPCAKTKNTFLSLKWCFRFWLCSINCSLETIWRVNLISIDRITYPFEATERNGEREIEEENKEKVAKLIIDCCVFNVHKIELQVQERSLEHYWFRIIMQSFRTHLRMSEVTSVQFFVPILSKIWLFCNNIPTFADD